MVDGTVTQYSLIRLRPGSVYVVRLQAEDGRGGYNAALSTRLTTGSSSKAPPPRQPLGQPSALTVSSSRPPQEHSRSPSPPTALRSC